MLPLYSYSAGPKSLKQMAEYVDKVNDTIEEDLLHHLKYRLRKEVVSMIAVFLKPKKNDFKTVLIIFDMIYILF